MLKLPVIVGFGGINAAGRSSGSHSYKRMISDVLSAKDLASTWQDLAHRMKLPVDTLHEEQMIAAIKEGTCIRRIQNFNSGEVLCHHKATLNPGKNPPEFQLKAHKLSPELANYADMSESADGIVSAKFSTPLSVLIQDNKTSEVSTAGELPTGFNPGELYHSHHHPRGLMLTVYGASDALNSLGMEWSDILKHIKPDQISVYAGSAMAQVDEHGMGGLFRQPLCGNRITSKMLPLSFSEMPADFINSYILNSVGATGNNVGACASFLYNLRLGCADIQSGRSRVALVGNTEAPIVFDIIEGYRVMGALATDASLCELDNTAFPNHRRACRPFSTNTGFTLAEAAQFFILMDDELALELGATIYGSVADTYVHADANKKSIASPGVGNYITFAKATALAKAILGQSGLQNTYVQAHGTGTPQNRVTESHILNEVAKTFAIHNWPVTAIKSYVGHSISVAAGDQLCASLGVWQYGWIPGIKTIDHIAEDVSHSNLHILMDHLSIQKDSLQAVIINSKGFGGNNASSLVLSPQQTLKMLNQRYGQQVLSRYMKKNEIVAAKQATNDAAACQGQERIFYNFGQAMMDASSVTLQSQSIRLSEFAQEIDLPQQNPYGDCI